MQARMQSEQVQFLQIHSGSAALEGELIVPDAAHGIVLFAHGSGSSRHSPRNQQVARAIREAGVATLLFDLLTREEEALEARTRHLRFDIGLLACRLADATRTIKARTAPTARLKVGYFGASTGGGAALVAAAELGEEIGAVVSRGGRPDLAADALPRVRSPTLLIVGGLDVAVIQLNELAFARLTCKKELRIVPHATHLFEEAGTLEEVAKLAAGWFRSYLNADSGGDAGYRAA
ncbi:MAG TPA: dienelactone hydrolase family protein [Burkholderiales bacterium]|jgi:putative phosphoribosyl transferase|nr:dienelactone hydrolase family protein [Burkholderiales bacterium]